MSDPSNPLEVSGEYSHLLGRYRFVGPLEVFEQINAYKDGDGNLHEYPVNIGINSSDVMGYYRVVMGAEGRSFCFADSKWNKPLRKPGAPAREVCFARVE
ncbi:hypothetical protein EON80_25745 [bacterium]|nr:MAG: hypothetical protein EON80_25745 [bacterium]